MKQDIEIQRNVIEELKCNPILKANEIGVAVKNGIVTLSGIVDTYPKKVSVEKSVKKVKGVKGIAEDIEVILSENHKKTDAEIAQVVLNALEWHSSINIDKIKILVEDGKLTIEGSCDWDFQRKSATKIASEIVGVKEVINNITISGKPVPSDVKNKIREAFLRNADINSSNIKIDIDGGEVTLSGKVNSWSQLSEAEHCVWQTPGVSAIINKIVISDDF